MNYVPLNKYYSCRSKSYTFLHADQSALLWKMLNGQFISAGENKLKYKII